MEKAEKTLDDAAKKHMVEWEINGFRRTYPKLFKSIMEAMEEHARAEALLFAKWHDKTDALRNKPTRWTELYKSYKNKHPF